MRISTQLSVAAIVMQQPVTVYNSLDRLMSKDPVQLTFRYIFRLWLPLMATWLLMAISWQIVATVVATLPNPTVNLAAFGVAAAIGLIIEAPIVMMTNAASALCHDQQSYQLVRRTTYKLNVLITLLIVVMVYPPLYRWFTGTLMNLSTDLVETSRVALIWLLPWPAAIGFRRFYQGIALSSGAGRQITIGGISRMIATILTCFVTSKFSEVSGASVGCAGLSAGVIAEALAVRYLTRRTIHAVATRPNGPTPLTHKRFWTFYYPLIITAFISLGIEPLVTFFLGRSKSPIESLAVMPVVSAFYFAFCSFSLALQDAMVALLGTSSEAKRKLREFAVSMTLTLTFFVLLLAYTPLANSWLTRISGLSPEMTEFALLPLRLAAPIPVISMLFCYQVAVNIFEHRTLAVTIASGLEASGIALLVWLGLKWSDQTGAVVATASLTLGRLLCSLYLLRRPSKAEQGTAQSSLIQQH